MAAGHGGRRDYTHYDGIKAFSETDQTEDLKSISVPTLVLQGDEDKVVSIADAARKSFKPLRNGIIKTYPGFSHGMLTINADVLNADFLAFIHLRRTIARLRGQPRQRRIRCSIHLTRAEPRIASSVIDAHE